MQRQNIRLVTPGFTMIEMLLSVTLLSTIALLGIPEYHALSMQNGLDIGTHTIVHTLRRAALRTAYGEEGSSWGVHTGPLIITLFKGDTYATRDTSYDEQTSLPTQLTVTGSTDVIFFAPYGTPSSSATITVATSNSVSQTITINGKGLVDY